MSVSTSSLEKLFDRPIAFHKSFVQFGGITAALMLSQACYWQRQKTNSRVDGYFYKTREEWMEETGMSEREFRTAREKLKQHGVLKWVRAGIDGKCHYRVNFERIIELLSESENRSGCVKTTSPDVSKRQNRKCRNDKSLYTETTTETTQRVHSVVFKKKTTLKFPTEEQFWRWGLSTEYPQDDLAKAFLSLKANPQVNHWKRWCGALCDKIEDDRVNHSSVGGGA